MVAALLRGIGHPLLRFRGRHGSGKSVVMEMIAQLIDPSPVPRRSLDGTVRDWGVQARASWVAPFDNVSSIGRKLADALCRGATGGGVVERALHERRRVRPEHQVRHDHDHHRDPR